MALTRGLLGALLVGGAIVACREVSICSDANECPDESGAGYGATNGRTAGGNGGTSRNRDEAGQPGKGGEPDEGGRGGEPGQAGRGGEPDAGGQGGQAPRSDAGASSEPSQNECPRDSAECDGSSLTTCETDLNTSVRHCGACDRPCDGLCVLGTCKAPELMFKGASMTAFVVAHDAAFAVLINRSDSKRALYRFDLQSGEARLVTQLENPENSISLGPDRVYLHVFEGVLAVTLDGSQVELVENDGLAISPFSFGVTAQGLYYVHFGYLAGTEPEAGELVWTLYYRPHLATKWQVLEQGPDLEILSSGSGCLVVQRGSDEQRELAMVVGSQLTKIDGLPPQWDDLLVVEDEIVVLTSEPSELWWFDSFGLRRHYPIDPPSFSGNTLTFASPQGVAIQSQLDGQQSVRTYGSDGPAPWAAGISRKSVMMFVNRPDLWYLYVPNWSDPPLLYRARMLEDADL